MDRIYGRMDIAVEYGVDVSIFIENIRYWTESNAAIKENFIEGRYWMFYTLEGFSNLYPIWSRDQVKRLIQKCKNADLLLVADFNDNPYKRTKWYSLSDKALAIYGVEITADGLWRNRHIERAEDDSHVGRNRHVEECNSAKCTYGEIAKSIKEKEDKKEENKKENPPYSPPEGDEPALDKKPKRKRRAPKSEPTWQAERFERFWAAYPRDEDRAKAVEQWDLLREDKSLAETYHGDEDAFLDEVARGLQRHLTCEDWKAGVAIPYAFRWLRDRRWTERKKTGKPDEVHRPMRPPRKSHIEIIEGEEVTVYDD